MSTPTFAALLRDHRTAAGLSQSALARMAGFDHSYVSRLEDGTRAPSRETVDVLCFALGLSRAARNRLTLAAGHLPVDLAETAHLLVSVPPAVRAQIDGLLRALATTTGTATGEAA